MMKLLAPVGSFLAGIALLVFSADIRQPPHITFGPRFWPQALGWGLVIVNALIIGRAALDRHKRDGAPNAHSTSNVSVALDWRRAFVPAALMLALPLCIQIFGFIFGTLLFLVAFMRAVGYAKWWSNLSVAVAFTIIVSLFFTRVTYMPLPKGVGPFYHVSLMSLRVLHAI